MANIRINHANILGASGRCDDARNKVKSARASIRTTANQIDQSIKNRANISNRINNICSSLDDISNRINSIKNVCNNSANRYKNTDQAQKARARQIDVSKVGKVSSSVSRFK